MKTSKICILAITILSSTMIVAQPYTYEMTPNSFQSNFDYNKRYHSEKTKDYKDIEGSPYLNSEFINGTFYLKDTAVVKLPIRYNLYTGQMEYQSEGVSYTVGSPQSLTRVLLGGSEFIYLSFIEKGGYFELVESGKCRLVLKKKVVFKPSEGAKPIIGLISARFDRMPDVFYLVINHNEAFKIVNLNSVINSLQDQKTKIENFIKQEKIKNTKRENLIKIIHYYNSL